MEYIRQTIGSDKLVGIFDIPPTLRNKKVEVIILSVEDNLSAKPEQKKRPLGFLKDKVPPLPDSFFEPLPEEDLQAWGL